MDSVATRRRAGEGRNREVKRQMRRAQIIGATVGSINKVGFAETTLATVAKEAGISQAAVVFHFKSKNDLLVATLQSLTDDYVNVWEQALEAAGASPIRRICALAAADFDPSICNRRLIAVWYAFWGASKARPKYMKICARTDDARSQAMREACRGLVDGDDFDDIATVIDGVIDGMWQYLLLHPPFKRSDALRIVFKQLQRLFPGQQNEILMFYEASTKKAGTKT